MTFVVHTGLFCKHVDANFGLFVEMKPKTVNAMMRPLCNHGASLKILKR